MVHLADHSLDVPDLNQQWRPPEPIQNMHQHCRARQYRPTSLQSAATPTAWRQYISIDVLVADERPDDPDLLSLDRNVKGHKPPIARSVYVDMRPSSSTQTQSRVCRHRRFRSFTTMSSICDSSHNLSLSFSLSVLAIFHMLIANFFDHNIFSTFDPPVFSPTRHDDSEVICLYRANDAFM
jgi:hypothetical protein